MRVKEADLVQFVPEEREILCNMCSGTMKHYKFGKTYIWTCNFCPNVQFEYYGLSNVLDLKAFTELEDVKDEED